MFSGPRFASLVVGTLCFGLSSVTLHAGDLASDVREALRASTLSDHGVAYSIVELDTKAVLAQHNEQKPFLGASNVKVLTTGAALLTLGADFAFQTKLILTQTAAGASTLTLVGSGDPALFDPEAIRADGTHGNWSTVSHAVASWASALRDAGITRIHEVVIDARIFDGEGMPEGDGKWKSNAFGTYAVPVHGLNLAANVAVIDPEWHGKGAPTLGSVNPPLPLTLVKNSASCTTKSASTFVIHRGARADEITFQGALPKSHGSFAVSVSDPVALAGPMLVREFGRVGVEIAGSRIATAQDPAAEGTIVLPVLTTPIATVLRGANTDSKNIYAEALTKRMGAALANGRDAIVGPNSKPGSWDLGFQALGAAINARVGPRCDASVCLVDGSGLSDKSRMTSDTTARWLAALASDPTNGPTYFASFARPGQAGTLKNRFKGTTFQGVEVYGKSGYIAGVSCLSGIVVASESGRTLVYSILCNGVGDRVAAAKTLHETIVRRLAAELTPRSTRTANAAGH